MRKHSSTIFETFQKFLNLKAIIKRKSAENFLILRANYKSFNKLC